MGVRKGRGSGAARRRKSKGVRSAARARVRSASKPRSGARSAGMPPSGARGAAPEAPGTWAAALAARSPGERRYWLVKSEPLVFSFDDLEAAPGRTTNWDGVRNFTARNFLRDGMKRGDGVLFYHSMATPPAIVGTCDVVREGYPDPSAVDPKHEHFDPRSDPSAPTWFMVDIRAAERLPRAVTLPEIRQRRELAQMALLRIGRLSVTPVTPAEWRVIRTMGGLPQ